MLVYFIDLNLPGHLLLSVHTIEHGWIHLIALLAEFLNLISCLNVLHLLMFGLLKEMTIAQLYFLEYLVEWEQL